jgi:hypothetical protein
MAAQGYDPALTNTVDILKQFSRGVDTYSILQESQKKENAEQAQADFAQQDQFTESLRGMGLTDADIDPNAFHQPPSSPLNLGAGYDEAWDQIAGKRYAAEQFQPAANQFYADNGQLPPEEFKSRFKAEVFDPYVRQLKSTHQVASFLPEAWALSDAVYKANQNKWNTSQIIERDAAVSASIRIDTQAALQTVLGVNSLEQLHDTQVYSSILKLKDTPAGVAKLDQLAQTTYGMYRNGMDKAKELGKTRAEYSAEFLDVVSGIAKQYGMPELLAYAFKSYTPTPEEVAAGKKPDNITVADAFREKVERDITSALEMQHKMKAAIKEQETEAKKKLQHTTVKKFNDDLFDIMTSDDPSRLKKALALQAQFREESQKVDLEPEANKFINSMVETIYKEKSFAHSSDDTVITELYSKGPRLNADDVLRRRSQLEEKDFVRLMQRSWDYEKAQKDRAYGETKYLEHKALQDMQEGIENAYVIRNPITGVVEPESQYTLGKLKQMIGTYYQTNRNSSALALQEYYQKHILPVLPVPKNLYNPKVSADGSTPPQPTKMKTKSGKEIIIER